MDDAQKAAYVMAQTACMMAEMEATMMPVVIYSARQKNGATPNWVRPIDEFCDGRFEPVDMATVPLTKLSRT